MKNALKTFIKIAAVLAVLFFGVGFMPALVLGFLSLKTVDLVSAVAGRISAKRQAGMTVDEETRRQNIAAHKEKVRKRYWDRRSGCWNRDALPLDMVPGDSYVDGSGRKVTVFNCSGVDKVEGRVVRGRFGRSGVEFSTVINDSRKAEAMASYIAENGILGTQVVREGDGAFRIVSDNAVDMNTIIKEFYPPKEMNISREIKTTRQYIVSGCKNYEEALAKFRKDPVRYCPSSAANVFVSYTDTVDGVRDHEVCAEHARLDCTTLEAGQYVIDAVTTEVYSRNVTVNGGVDCTPEAMRSLASDHVNQNGFSRSEDLVEDQCVVEPVLSCGSDEENVRRCVRYNDRSMNCCSPDDPALDRTGASLVLRFGSIDEFEAVMSGDKKLEGRMVLVDRQVPAASDGEFVVTVPADAALINSLRMKTGVPEEIAGLYSDAGVSREDGHRICVMDELARNDYVSAELSAEPDLSRAVVNGVPIAEFRERFLNESIVEDSVEMEQWLRDASLIQSVRMELDLRNQQMVVTSVIQRGDRVESRVVTKSLDSDETRMMSERHVTDGELKELLIQSYPDCFATYRDAVSARRDYSLMSEQTYRSVLHDPVSAFVRGEKPELEKDYRNRVARQKKERRKTKQATGVKPTV